MQISGLLRNVVRFFREKNKSNGAVSRRKRARVRQIEMLEARHMMVAAIWHNVLQPLNVSGEPGGSVDPLDVLTVINEINNPKYSVRGALIQDVPAGQSLPYFDVNCNSSVDPLDVLSIINAINSGVYDPSWNFEASQNTTGTQGHVTISACSPKLIEGDSLSTELNQTIVLPDNTSAVRVSFEAPVFDILSRDAIRDAFEIVLLDRSGQPLSLPYGANREAIYNWSENVEIAVGPATKTTTLPAGSISTATFNLTGLAAGTPVQVVVRLVNDDTDTNSSVVIRRVEIVDIGEIAPTGMSFPESNRPAFVPVDASLLTDVSPSVKPIYGRTTLVDDKDIVVTDLQMINQGSNALSGRIVVAIDNLSDPNIGVMHPDGFLPGGRPYFVLNGTTASGWLASGDKTAIRELRFKNPSRQQFTYTLTTLAELNSPPSGFTSIPLIQIEAGKKYEAIAHAEDPDGQSLTYSIVVGPNEMTIDSTTGKIGWLTTTADVGNQAVVLRATDPFGLSAEQAFTIAVFENLPNRPPVFTSTPPTDAVIAAPFEVLTYKTGSDPVAVTVGNFGIGTSYVTANPGDATLGFLGTDRVSKPLSVGEPNPGYFKTSFVSPVPVDLGFNPNTYQNIERTVNTMETADVNQDGTPDLIVSVSTGSNDNFSQSQIGHLGVRFGNGDGTFRQGWETTLPTVTDRTSVALGMRYIDVTGDGINDFVATQYRGKTLLVYKGLAGGTFNDAPIITNYSGSSSLMQVADLNADGKPDVVLFENNPNGQFRVGLSVLLGNGDGSFAAETFYAGANDNSGSGYIVDVDGQNGLDLVRTNYTDTRLEVRLNDGTGHFGNTINSAAYAFGNNGLDPMTKFFLQAITAYFGDFDGDGKTDASVSTTQGLIFLKGTGTGSFGDGTAAGNRFNIAAYVNVGTNTFPATYYNEGKPIDFNADGKLDVIYGDSQNAYVTIGLGRGDGTFVLSSYNTQFTDDIGIGSSRGIRPSYLVNVADYNRDGVLDVAVGEQSNGTRPGSVAIILGDQLGTLRAVRIVPFDSSTIFGHSVVADFTGDGIADIASLNHTISMSVGNGDGTFQPYQKVLFVPAGGGEFLGQTLIAADFDKDGNMDLAWNAGAGVQSGAPPRYIQAFGLGNGTFQTMPIINTIGGTQSTGEQAAVVGDFNSDGYPDLAWRANEPANGFGGGSSYSRVDILLFDPVDKRFRQLADTTHLLGPFPKLLNSPDSAIGYADINGDGMKELFTHSTPITTGTTVIEPERLYVFEVKSVQGSDASQLFTRTRIDNPGLASVQANGMVAGDFDRDGKLDLAVLNGFFSFTVAYGNGDFTFRNQMTYVNNNTGGIRGADVNGDGRVDLVTNWDGFLNSNQRSQLSVLIGQPDGTFGAPEQLANVFGKATFLAIGDFNLDGKDDFATASGRDYAEVYLAAPPSLASVQSGDINGDGKLDLVGITTGFNRVKVLLGNGDNTFSRELDLFVGASPVDLKLADINGDGILDIVTANRIGQSISILTNTGIAFTRNDIALPARPSKLSVTDITGDNRLDVATVSEAGQVFSVIVNSATGLGSASALNLGFAPSGLALADVTGDGKPDAVISDSENKRIFILPGQGDGSVGSSKTIPLSVMPADLAIVDMNFDGRLDIEVTLPDDDRVGVLFNRGGSRFTSPQLIKVGDKPNAITVADVNADNKPDLLVTNGDDNTLSVILNRFDPANLYRYTPTAYDPDGDPITFDFENAPGGMLYDEASGQVLWAPMPDQIGSNEVILRVSDNRGGSATQGYTIAVTAPTTTPPPVFTSQPVVAIPIDATYSYLPSNTNPGNNPLRYSLVNGPDGLTVDPTTGALNWDPRNPGLSLGLRRPDQSPTAVVGRGRILTPDAPSLHSPSLTAEGWFRFDSNAAFMSLIQKPIFDQFFNFSASWSLENAGGAIRARVGDGQDAALITAPVGITLNVWTHLAMTFDNDSRLLKLYVNGVAVASAVAARPIAYDNTPLNVGRAENILATVTGIRVWNVARTGEEIRTGMNSLIASDSPGLVLDYSFKGGPSAQSVLDLSPNHNHGSLSTSYDLYNFPTRIPSLSFTGTHAVTIQVEDGKGGVGTQSFNLEIVSQQRGAISGTVNDSLTQSGLDGWTVYVDTNRNSYRDPGEGFATTDAQGQYTLSNLLATTTPVAIEKKSGFESPALREVSVVAEQTVTSIFQVISASPGLIQGRLALDGVATPIAGFTVFIDANGNRIRDDGESFARTDRLGNFTLSELPAGNYVVRVDTPAGWHVTTPVNGSSTVTLFTNQNSSGNDFTLAASPEAASTPAFVSTPQPNVLARTQFRYVAVAIDPLGRPLTYTLLAAPDLMAIDARTGVIVWTPTAKDVGPTRVILKATNDANGVAIQDFSFDVLAPNSAPIVTSDASVSAVVSFALSFDLLAQDAEQAALNYSLVSSPSGMSIDDAKGRILWTPTAIQAGLQTAIIRIHDGAGGETRQTINFNVASANVNGMPVITSGPRSTGQVGTSFVGRVSAIDIDNNPLKFSLVKRPVGMTITDDGRLNWLPNSAQAGKNRLRVRVDDGQGGSDEKDFSISIDSLLANRAPVLTPVDSALAVVDKIFAEDFSSSDEDGDAVAYQLISGPSGLSLDSTRGTLRWQPAHDQLGVHSVTVRVVDPFGGFDEHSFDIVVRSVGGPPAILSVPPTMAAAGETYIYSVQATDADRDPLHYSLSASPTGMTINAVTGVIAWTPEATQVGLQSAIVRVSDGAGGFTTQSFSIRVTAGVLNHAPVTSTQPTLDAIVGVPYVYTLQATDPEGGAITYAVRSGPAGLSINSSTGVVTWTPTAADLGSKVVVLTATDPEGAAGVQSFLVSVAASNSAPVIMSTAPKKVSQGGMYRYDVIARDPDREPLTYELVSGPDGMTLDSLGRVRWQTALDTPLGARSAAFTVRDGRAGIMTQTIDFNVVADTIAPRVSIVIHNDTLFPWSTEPARVKVTATDDVGVTNITLSLDGEMIALSPDGTTSVFYGGKGRLEAFAVDAAGNRGRGVAQVRMRDGSNNGATTPTALITSLQDGDLVGGFVSIVGTASGEQPTYPVSYVLSYRRGEEDAFHEISRGTSSVTAGVLGKWDTTLLENDEYVFKLEVTDEFNNFAAVERAVGVSGNFKLGNFRLSFADITIPVAGIPITLARTYDTLKADRDSELGFGWSLEFRNANLRTGLAKSGLEDLGIYTPFKPGTKVYLTLPGGTREGYTFTPDIRALPGFGDSLVIATPRFTPDRGVKNTLSVRSGTYIVNPFGELMGAGGQPYNPAAEEFGGGYRVTTQDGLTYFINGGTGKIDSITDANGNRLTLSESGISGSGVSVSFERNQVGRITAVVAPDRSRIEYGYSSKGDLISVRDANGNTTQLIYNATRAHYLASVVDPLGKTGIRAEYDAAGRVVRIGDADGNNLSITTSLNDNAQVLVDALGNQTFVTYDNQGNTSSVKNSLGNTTSTTFDENNNKLTETDPLGRVTRYTYDAFGNLLTVSDPAGAVTRFSYANAQRGLVGSITDALGNTTTYTYDSKGNPTGFSDTAGLSSGSTRDSRGNLASFGNPISGLATYTYNSAGNLTSETDANGNATQFVYDSKGRLASRTWTQIINGTATSLTDSYIRDANGNLLEFTNARGERTHFAYDANNHQVSQTDALGRVTRFVYNDRGLPIETIYPDATSGNMLDNPRVRMTYDALGRMTAQTDELGHQTLTVYDAIGQAIRQILPDNTPGDLSDNPRVQMEYDAAGQMTARIDENGNRTKFEYDTAGNQVLVRDALGNETHFAFDFNGRQTKIVDALGNQTAYTYDAGGRMTKIVHADGSTVQLVFNGSGLLTAQIDENGKSTQFEYNELGRTSKVIEPNGSETLYGYDEHGNLTTLTDANGHVTTYQYDALDRRIAVKRPLGEADLSEFDAVGNLVAYTDFNGDRQTFSFDERNRMTRKRIPGETDSIVSYLSNGLISNVLDARGTTSYTYDVRNRLTGKTDPDGRSLTYTYDAAGNNLSTTSLAGTTRYAYDELNRREEVTDANSNTTRYTYDVVGRLAQTNFANGVVESRVYDSDNRITRIGSSLASTIFSSFIYTHDAKGNRLSVTELGGRRVEYAYDDLYRLTKESTFPTGGSLAANVTTYTYDAVGNRLTTTDSANGVTTSAYDADDQLTEDNGAVRTTYAYDANGNRISKTAGTTTTRYDYSSENRLVGVDTNGNGTEEVTYQYDVSGNRVARTESGATTFYQVDTNRILPEAMVEYASGGTVITAYSYGNALVSQTRGGATAYYHADSLGSTTKLTNSSGAILNEYTYDAFGGVVAESGSFENELLYNAQRRDSTTGLDYLRARNYDSATGSFTGVDPFDGVIQSPNSLHNYMYAGGNPVNASDPTGRFSLIEISVTTSTLEQVQKSLLNNSFEGIKRVGRIADKMLVPGTEMVNTGLDLALSDSPLAYRGYDMYAIGTQLRAAGFQAIGIALAGIYLDTVRDLLNVNLEVDQNNPLSRIFGPIKLELTLLSAKLQVGESTLIDANAADIEGDIKTYLDKTNEILRANHLAEFIQNGTGPFEQGVIESVSIAKRVQARLERYTG